jgi:hypothetical protein
MTDEQGRRMSRQPASRRFLAFFVPSASVGLLACLVVAVVAQQGLRQGADDPQHQMAEDAVARLDAGVPPATVVEGPTIDLGGSLAPFLVIYDSAGNVVATDGRLDGVAPVPPSGVLETATAAGIDRVTWQPRPGVRMAVVVLPWAGGTVLAGRSLRRVEEIEANLERISAVGAIGIVAVAAVASAFAAWVWSTGGGKRAG